MAVEAEFIFPDARAKGLVVDTSDFPDSFADTQFEDAIIMMLAVDILIRADGNIPFM